MLTTFTNLTGTGFSILMIDCSFEGFQIFRKFNRIGQAALKLRTKYS